MRCRRGVHTSSYPNTVRSVYGEGGEKKREGRSQALVFKIGFTREENGEKKYT